MKPAFERIKDAVREKDSLLCVGLDPSDASVKKFFSNHPLKRGKPAEDAETFCRFLIDETKDLVCCFKPNSAFFEALGPEGFNVNQGRIHFCSLSRASIVGSEECLRLCSFFGRSDHS